MIQKDIVSSQNDNFITNIENLLHPENAVFSGCFFVENCI